MSIPGHQNELVLVGDVREVYADERGATLGVILLVNAGEPCEVPVMFPAPQPDVAVGDRLWVRGRLAFEPLPHGQEALLFVHARWIEVVTRPRSAQSSGPPPCE
jgi:hypothetical protein